MSDPIRRCILSGERAPQHLLIRLAVSPDGELAPDVGARAPGRGAWLGVSRGELEDAIAKGRMKGALARAFKTGGKTGGVTVPDNLPEWIEAQLRQATLDRLGLEARASNLLTGSEKIAERARSGRVSLLLHACDSRPDGRRKLDQALRVGTGREGSGETGLVLPVDRDALSMALGRDNAVHAAILGEEAAARVLRHLARWLNYTGCRNGAAPAYRDGQAATHEEDFRKTAVR
ncbi:DUF448 domain-containing protein [Novosphingopyxis sp.]|uniref:DUF448 domain-containing protein n=1 Tax=Novosphingopyxis sp. TaxID=2709690 RepID=UPI003B5CD980